MYRRRRKSPSSSGSTQSCSSLPARRCRPTAYATRVPKSSVATCRMCTSPGSRASYKTTRTDATGTARCTAQSANLFCTCRWRTAEQPSTPDLFQRFAVCKLRYRVVELSAHHEINIAACIQSFFRLDVSVRTNERDLQPGIHFLDFPDQLDVAVEPDRGGVKDQELIVFANLDCLRPVDLVRRC